MKKTLITLLALAGVASATPSDWTCDPTTIKDKEVVVSGSSVHSWNVSGVSDLSWDSGHTFTIAFTLDVTSLDSSKNYAVMSIKDAGYNGLASVAIKQGSLDFILYNDSSATSSVSLSALGAKSSLTLVINRQGGSSINMVAYADGKFDQGTTLTGKSNWHFSRAFTAINFGGTANGNYTGHANTLMPNNANAAQFTLTGAAYMTGGVATAEQLKTYYQLVPEPTTACLSLLALAGLAARRRRR